MSNKYRLKSYTVIRGEPRPYIVNVKLTEAEMDYIHKCANKTGLGVSGTIRELAFKNMSASK
jgi:hypothetical protein